MNIRNFETVIWLAHYRNFRQAAEHLHVTQAAVSTRLATVEQEVGVSLFKRDSQGVTLTDAGKVFLDTARTIVQEYRQLTDSLRVDGELKGSARIGVPPSMAMLLLPDLVARLRDEHPGLRLEIVTDGSEILRQRLMAGQIDVCVTVVPPHSPQGLRSVPLCTLGMYWIARPGFIPQSRELLSVRDLLTLPLISYPAGTLNFARIREYLGADDARAKSIHESNALATTIHMVANGIGVAVIPPVVIQQELREGRLAVLWVEPRFPSTEYAAQWHQDNHAPHIRRIIEIALDVTKKLAKRFDPTLFIAA